MLDKGIHLITDIFLSLCKFIYNLTCVTGIHFTSNGMCSYFLALFSTMFNFLHGIPSDYVNVFENRAWM